MLAQGGAIAKRGPHAAGSGHIFQVYKTDITSVSTAATLVLPDAGGIPMAGCWVTFSPSVDCYIHFGRIDLPASSSTVGEKWVANERYELWINDTEEPYFRVIRASADGVLERRRSNL